MCCRICNWEAISNARWRCNYIARTIVIIPIPPLLLKWSAVFWRLCSFRVLIANATAIIERVVPTPIMRYCADNIMKNNTWSAWDPENEKKNPYLALNSNYRYFRYIMVFYTVYLISTSAQLYKFVVLWKREIDLNSCYPNDWIYNIQRRYR